MEQLHDENPPSLYRDLAGIRHIRYLLLTMGGVGLLFAIFISFFFPTAALIWNRFIHIAIFAVIPVNLLVLGYGLRVENPISRKATIIGIWGSYALGIIGEIIFFVLSILAAAVMDFSWDPKDGVLSDRDFLSYKVLFLYNVIVMLFIARDISRFLKKESVVALFEQKPEASGL